MGVSGTDEAFGVNNNALNCRKLLLTSLFQFPFSLSKSVKDTFSERLIMSNEVNFYSVMQRG